MKLTGKYRLTGMQWLAVAVLAMLATACASIGRPEGGPRDEKPPVFVSSNPKPGATNVNRQRIDLYFNENVQLEDAFNKVVVSPAQKDNARVSANGRHVTVDLQDSLLPNTTYTIDFADAIKDLNEGNVLDGFTTYFSTGNTIDSLRISGMVFDARTLEPAQGMLVGVYSNLADTAIRTLPLERIARTNQLGQFTIHNLKPGDYHIYALNDLNRDFKWDRSEDIAFYPVTVSPYVEEITVVDTLRSSLNLDSLVERRGYAYFPNDVLLTWFNQNYKPQYLKDYSRPERSRIEIKMSTKADSLPRLTIVSEKNKGLTDDRWAIVQKTETLDSLQYWITDTSVLATDSLMLAVEYLRTDTTDQLTWRSDTLRFFFKDPKINNKEKKKKKKDDEEEVDSVPKIEFFDFGIAGSGGTLDVNVPLKFAGKQPIDSINPSGVHLAIKEDTLWVDIKGVGMLTDTLNPLLDRYMEYKWKPGATYRVTIDSAAVTNIYGKWNNTLEQEFKIKELEEYSNLKFSVSGLDSCGIVELLDKGDKVIATVPVVKGIADFPYQNPGTVYARLFIDSNRNGKWDTGNLVDSIQPEEVYYFPKKVVLKKNWDISQDWNIYDTPLDMQKPYEIKKNRPKLKKGEQAPVNTDEEEEEEDNIFGDYNSYSNSRRNNNGRGNNRNANQGTGRYY